MPVAAAAAAASAAAAATVPLLPDGASAALGALVSSWHAALRPDPCRVVLTDGGDPRVVAAAASLATGGGVVPLLVAEPQAVASAARAASVDLPDDVEIVSPRSARDLPGLGESLDEAIERRPRLAARAPGVRVDPLYVGAAAVRSGHAEACVAGSTRPSADVLRAALAVIGLAEDALCVSSSFLMVMADGRILSFGDCAVIPEPTATQLAEVALATSATHRSLTGEAPVTALLSFSTKGSAEDRRVAVVREACTIAAARSPDLSLDGELQADAALDVVVARSKAPASNVAGRANVLVFPNLDAGNIGYKLTERLGHARAVGPLLQGLASPMNDLSRGCRTEEVEAVALVSALLARRSLEPRGATSSCPAGPAGPAPVRRTTGT